MLWSFERDLGHSRLLTVDSRGGRVLEGTREMVDDNEWEWIVERATGDLDHLVVATSLPFLLPKGAHGLEAWSEAVAEGAWGKRLEPLGEKAAPRARPRALGRLRRLVPQARAPADRGRRRPPRQGARRPSSSSPATSTTPTSRP